MANRFKYPAAAALSVVDDVLKDELGIHRFDAPVRSKAQLFAVGGSRGKQFAIVLGNTDVATGHHPAQQTRLLFERCDLPTLPGIELCPEPYSGQRIKNQQDSRISPANQVSCLVRDESALKAVLRWYAGRPASQGSDDTLEQIRVAKAAEDAGFDRTPQCEGGWTHFRSTAFAGVVGVAGGQEGLYRVAFDDAEVAMRLADEFELQAADDPGPWATRFDHVSGYQRLHALLRRAGEISSAIGRSGLDEFAGVAARPPGATEAVREVVQRVGQDIFRRTLIDYWGGKCAVTGLDLVEVLKASHIKQWARCETDEERLDVFNGLLLAPHLDALFDRGYITFSDEGELLRSASLTASQWKALGADAQSVRNIPLSTAHKRYLAWHRLNLYKGS